MKVEGGADEEEQRRSRAASAVILLLDGTGPDGTGPDGTDLLFHGSMVPPSTFRLVTSAR